MLRNDPPSGTMVKFVRTVQKAKSSDTAKLVRPLAKYLVDRPEDQFIVEFRGEYLTVQRQDIE
jgi:hypothetical protein